MVATAYVSATACVSATTHVPAARVTSVVAARSSVVTVVPVPAMGLTAGVVS